MLACEIKLKIVIFCHSPFSHSSIWWFLNMKCPNSRGHRATQPSIVGGVFLMITTSLGAEFSKHNFFTFVSNKDKPLPVHLLIELPSLDCLSSSLVNAEHEEHFRWQGTHPYNPIILFQWSFRREKKICALLDWWKLNFSSSFLPSDTFYEILLCISPSPEILHLASQVHWTGSSDVWPPDLTIACLESECSWLVMLPDSLPTHLFKAFFPPNAYFHCCFILLVNVSAIIHLYCTITIILQKLNFP